MTNQDQQIRERVAIDARALEARLRSELTESGGNLAALDEALASADVLAAAMGTDPSVMRLAAMMGGE